MIGGIIMFILSGKGKTHLDGQKGLTKDKPILEINAPDSVFVPLVVGQAIDFDVHVEPGDHVSVGTKLATRKSMYVPLYSPVSGEVKGIVKRMHATGRLQQHIEIVNDHQYESVKVLDIEDPDSLTSEEIVGAMKELGLVGLGGSGFPSYIKYGNTAAIDTILINGVECEPFITSDHVSMLRDIPCLFDGVEFMKKAANASKGIIAIKEHKPDLFAALKEEAAKHSNIEVVEVPDAYPMGWERTLVKQVTGKDFDRLPGEVGIIVNNSSTAMALSKGLRKGEGIVKRVVTFSGNALNNPQNVEVCVGTPVNMIVQQLGGYKDVAQGVVLNGGPMMGGSVAQDTFVITPYTNAITVMEKDNTAPMPCLKCGYCIEYCPANLQPVKIMQAEKAADVEKLEKLEVMRCVTCGMCSYICPSKIEVTDMVSKAKRRYQLASAKKK